MVDRVLVTGGTGKTGALVAEQLAAIGVETRIATRNPSKAGQVRFEWNDIATHDAALDDVDAIYLVAPTDQTDHLRFMRPFLDQAMARGVGQFVLLSAASLQEGDPMMGEVHAWLHANAPRWTVLRPSWFMQNFVTQHLPSILGEGCIYSATQDGRVAFIDAADVAAVAVRALVDPALATGERVLTGPEALSYDDVAQCISTVAQRPVRHCRLSMADLARRYTGFGIPELYAHALAGMDEAISRGSEDRTTTQVQRVTGREPTKLTEFLATYKDVFLSSP